MLLSRTRTALKAFKQNEGGSITVEFIIMIPLLFWAFMASYVYFDGYRLSTTNLKAAYTVSDVLSRETDVVDDDYIDALVELIEFLSSPDDDVDMRVTIVTWSEDDERYYVDWSENRGFDGPVTNNNIDEFEDSLPVLYDGDRMIMMETRSLYEPDFSIGIEDQELYNIVFTRPRFVSNIAYDDD